MYIVNAVKVLINYFIHWYRQIKLSDKKIQFKPMTFSKTYLQKLQAF